MRQIILMLAFFFLFTGALTAQENWSANLAMGLAIPQVDLSDNTYDGYRPNLAVTAGIGYHFNDYLRLRGDALAGQMNGNNEQFYYENVFYDFSLSGELNIVRFFSETSNFKVNLRLGAGGGLLNGRSYDINTDNLVTAIPADDAPYSIQTFALGGLNIGIPLSPVMDINLGYAHRYFFEDQPWIDAFDQNSSDMYGIGHLGFTYRLSKPRDPNKIEVDPQRFSQLRMRVDSLENKLENTEDQGDKIVKLERNNQSKERAIDSLRNQIDSLKSLERTATVATTKKQEPQSKVVDNQGLLDQEMYRVIIGSLASRAKAQQFIDRSPLDASEMIIVYIEDIDRFRVIYKSADNITLAKKYRNEARRNYRDAWIIKL